MKGICEKCKKKTTIFPTPIGFYGFLCEECYRDEKINEKYLDYLDSIWSEYK